MKPMSCREDVEHGQPMLVYSCSLIDNNAGRGLRLHSGSDPIGTGILCRVGGKCTRGSKLRAGPIASICSVLPS